ncbi:hypothetical protein BJV78DRAFT_685804 [Lactifluus subvellereus]|nr:hypothetical protein BJV78DRAFT_685804 [Lactifluus subvellereus]
MMAVPMLCQLTTSSTVPSSLLLASARTLSGCEPAGFDRNQPTSKPLRMTPCKTTSRTHRGSPTFSSYACFF